MRDDLITRLASYIDSEEGKEFIKELAKRNAKKEEEKKKAISYVKGKEYIKWFTDYLKEEDFLVCSNGFLCNLNTEVDFRNVKLLPYLFEVIDDYASKNYYYPTKHDGGATYSVRFGGTPINVGMNYLQGSMFFATLGQEDESTIDFTDIIKDRDNPEKGNIQAQLYHLSCSINEAFDKLPIEAVEKTIRDTVSNYKKCKTKTKTL